MKKVVLCIQMLCTYMAAISQNPILLKDVYPGATGSGTQQIVKTSNYIFFNAEDDDADANRGLYRTDGSAAGTIKLNLSYPGYISTKAEKLTPLGNKIVFAGDNIANYGEIWASDGTQAGTVAIERFQPTATNVAPVKELNTMGSYVYYSVVNGSNKAQLKRTDGTVAGTSLLYEFSEFAGIPEVVFLTPFNDILYFIVYDVGGTGVDQLWRSDGTTAGTYMVYNFTTARFVESYIMIAGDLMYIMIGSQSNGVRENTLWKSDGTAAGTVPVKLIGSHAVPGPVNNIYPPFAAIGSTLYFAGLNGNGKELWKTDGTDGGTFMLADINAGSASSNPAAMTVLNNTLYFSATTAAEGSELWKINGATAALVKDIYPGISSSSPAGLTVSNNTILFRAAGDASGTELWITDETTVNTRLVKEINTAGASSPSLITAINNTVYLTANNGTQGQELYKFDNTDGIAGLNKIYVNDNVQTGDVFTTAVGNNANMGTRTAPVATVTYALSVAQAGDTIYVDAGNYAEQVIIDKGITIAGAGENLTFFTPPASTLVPAPGPFSEIGLFETTQGIGDVHIRNLSINSNGSSQNIIIQSGGSVKNCTLLNGGQGIFFRVDPATKTALIENNIIQPDGIGINCQGSGLTAIIRNNTISKPAGYYAGIFAGLDFGPIVQLTANNNIIINYFGDGFLANSFNSNFTQNSIVGLNGQGVAIQQFSGNTANATCNWYGSSNVEAIAGKISGAVIFSPWLTNGVDTDVAAIGFQPLENICSGRQNTFYVNDNSLIGDVFTTAVGNNGNTGLSTSPVATLLEALNRAKAGDTIYIDAGTYIENVIINKSIVIRGVKYGQNPGSSLNRGNESVILPATQTLGLAGTIIQPAADDITIDGLLLDGDNPALTAGSNINGVDVNIGCGIYNNNIVAAYLTVKNTIVKNVQTYGIGLFRALGNQAGPAVPGNLFTQNRVDNCGTRGIVFGYNAFGDITNNYISRCGGSGTWFSQQRVANVNNTPSIINGNIIENCNLGMQSSALETPTSVVRYVNNEISNNTTTNFAGISLLVNNASGVVLSNNKISGYANAVYINATNPSAPILVNNNSITSYSTAIQVVSTNPVNAGCNWHGSAAVQDFYTKLNTNYVSFAPWLTNGTDTDAATGFQPTANSCDGSTPLITLNSFTNATCNGAANGSINITASYGKAPFVFTWTKVGDANFISNDEDPNNFTAGTYRLAVTDANGTNFYVTSLQENVPDTVEVTITEPTVLTASITNTSTACSNIAIVAAGGGTPGYTYLWSNGATSPTIGGVPVGTYTVTVTDTNGCTAEASVTLTVSEAFNPSASVTDVTCFAANDGVITVTNINGTAPFMFSKDGGVSFVNGSLPFSFTNLAPGNYTIAVKDANGCVGFVERTVTQPTALTATIGSIQSTCFGSSTGAINITVSGGVPAYSYSWTGLDVSFSSSQLNISSLAAGNYSLTVTDKNNCTYSVVVSVPTNSAILVNETVNNVTCRGAANGSITVNASGGTNSSSGFSYLWNTGATATTISNLVPGNYGVRVTDNGSGCFMNKSFTITQPASALALTTAKTNASGCNSLGTITATGSGGTSPYTYSVNGSTIIGNSIGGLYAGDYTVTVTDANGCTTSKLVTITDNGSDEYEGNNSKNQAKTIAVGTSVNARLAVANDAADWFRFTAPGSTSGLYSVKIMHPNTVYTFNVYASGNNTAAIVPLSLVNTGEKHYQLTAGTTYFVSITTANLSFECYNLTVSALEPIEITANTTQSRITVETAPTVDILKAFTYPNPHNGNFTLSIESPEEGVATIEMFTVNGQKLSERKANVVMGKGNTVKYSNMNHAILFYRVRIGKHIVTGKIISPN